MTHCIISSVAIGLAVLASLSASAQESNATASSDAEQTVASVVERYAPGSITSTEIADRALADVKRQHSSVEARFAEDEAICYRKFFVTSCMDAAKDRRRLALKQLNTIEVEANAYNRRARVDEKDRALRERQAKQGAKAVERADTDESDTQHQAPATPQDIAEIESRARQATSAPSAAAPTENYNVERAARHGDAQRQDHEKETAEAKKREENIKAFEKKQQHALERQREIAAKKMEKEQKQPQTTAEKP
jgi:colicin import membrane protein